MAIKLKGFQRKIHHTRYAQKALNKEDYLNIGQPVVVLTKDGKYPTRELGTIHSVEGTTVGVKLDTGDYETTFPNDIFYQELHNVDILLETEFEQTASRVANAVADTEQTKGAKAKYYGKYFNAISDFRLVPAGRILTGAGDDSKVTLFNCYVIDVEPHPNNVEAGRDSRQAIFHHMGRISEIMARGGGVGTNLSTFRPRFSPLSQTKGRSTGAVYIGNMFSGLTDFIEQGNRRGAQMLTLHVWHPDVFYSMDSKEDFIGAKQRAGFMEGNNSSVLISDKFMKAVENDEDWELVFPDTTHPDYNRDWDGDLDKWIAKHGEESVVVHNVVRALDIWNKLMDSNKVSAEPAVIYIDEMNRKHNGHYRGTIKATNPCGEQGLLPNSTCNLSAINLGRMVKEVGEDSEGILYEIDFELLKETVETGVRFLDSVIELNYYFDKDMEYVQKGERRLGLGVLGVHDLLIALRKTYGSDEGNAVLESVFEVFRDTAYRTSIELAKEKGAFPFFDKEGYLASGFVQTLPQDIQEDIAKYGIRNLTLLTIAPTGTTGSMTPSLLDENGSVSTGIEPHFAMKYNRMSRIGNTVQYAGVALAYKERNPDKELPEYYVGAMDLSPEAHVKTQAVAQKYIDSSISKTINAPKGYTVEQVKTAYELGYKLGLKGMTIYVDGSRNEQILSVDTDEDTDTIVSKESQNIENTAPRHKFDGWECGNCGSTDFHVVEGCPQCDVCGSQSCSL